MPSQLEYRPAVPSDVAMCVDIRGRTRENAVSVQRLSAVGITVASWSEAVRLGSLPGYVCVADGDIVGYCFGATASGEVEVLALLPAFEHQGIGKALLNHVVETLSGIGFTRLFLGCSPDPASRSYGFYRHLGWRSTGAVDARGDEVLEYFVNSGDTH
jgi:GNAT superfamily N-acetyltransferase